MIFRLSGGKSTRVDLSTHRRLIKLGRKWQSYSGGNTYYARAGFYDRELGRNRIVYLHRWILNAPADKFVDHINGDGLDNLRGNLRLVTRSQNGLNRQHKPRSRSGYWGIRLPDRRCRSWRANIVVRGKEISIGGYLTAELAACARDYYVIDCCLEEFARMNFEEQPFTREEVELGRTRQRRTVRYVRRVIKGGAL
jgi:hypothetical protein